jgi:hypothetical protein
MASLEPYLRKLRSRGTAPTSWFWGQRAPWPVRWTLRAQGGQGMRMLFASPAWRTMSWPRWCMTAAGHASGAMCCHARAGRWRRLATWGTVLIGLSLGKRGGDLYRPWKVRATTTAELMASCTRSQVMGGFGGFASHGSGSGPPRAWWAAPRKKGNSHLEANVNANEPRKSPSTIKNTGKLVGENPGKKRVQSKAQANQRR